MKPQIRYHILIILSCINFSKQVEDSVALYDLTWRPCRSPDRSKPLMVFKFLKDILYLILSEKSVEGIAKSVSSTSLLLI